jgi:hypothetical protein
VDRLEEVEDNDGVVVTIVGVNAKRKEKRFNLLIKEEFHTRHLNTWIIRTPW